MEAEAVFRCVDIAGVIANAMIGGAVARRKGFDIIGFLVLAIISGMGGGMIRDVLIGVGFPVALTDPLYLSSAIVTAIVMHFLDLGGLWATRTMVAADALVLGCWSATGASKALNAGLAVLPAIFLGVITAIGGAMLREVIVNEIPSVFGGKPIYASISVLGAGEMVLAQKLGYYHWGMAIAIIMCFTLAVLARWRRWVLPTAARLTVPLPSMRQRLASRTQSLPQAQAPASQGGGSTIGEPRADKPRTDGSGIDDEGFALPRDLNEGSDSPHQDSK